MNPTNVAYGSASGGRLVAGRFAWGPADYGALVDTIAAKPAGSMWIASTNAYQSAWPGPDYANTGANPAATLNAWPSIGWDSKRHGFWAWGGGHANSSSNEPYFWSAITGQWMLGFLPSEYVLIDSNGTLRSRSSDFNASPISSHTYHNNCYLPTLDRFLTFGGAQQPTGFPLGVWDESDPAAVDAVRLAGCYTLNPERLGLGFVGGRTGAHAHRNTSIGVNKFGARAWQLHDWFARVPAPPVPPSHQDCGAAVVQENGHDVVYYMAGGTRRVCRAEFIDDDPAHDLLSVVTDAFDVQDFGVGHGQFAIDPVKRIGLVVPGAGGDLMFCDLKRARGVGSNTWQRVPLSGIAGAAMDVGGYLGLCFDTRRGKFLVYDLGNQMFELSAPAGDPTPTTGWTASALTITGTVPPVGSGGAQLMGMFRYASELGIACAIHDAVAGNVYFYKPTGWTDPRT